jgi:PST family polysaccharide transporter
VCNILAVKLALSFAGFVLLCALVVLLHNTGSIATALVLYGVVFGEALSPGWLFQGMEDLLPASIVNAASQVITSAAVLTFITDPSDAMLYAAILSVVSITVILCALVFVFFSYGLRLVRPWPREMIALAREGRPMFVSMLLGGLWSNSNAFLLGVLTNSQAVGYYSGAERITRAAIGLFGPLSQAGYPRASRLAAESRIEARRWSSKLLVMLGGMALSMMALFLIGAPLIIKLLAGPQFYGSTVILRILSVSILTSAISSVFGLQLLVPFGLDAAYLRTMGAGALGNVVVGVAFVSACGYTGMAYTTVIVGIAVAVMQGIVLTKHGLLPSFRWPWSPCYLNPA